MLSQKLLNVWRQGRVAKIGSLIVAALLMTACAPSRQSFALKNLQSQLARQYHECVPLGWAPVPIAGTYYPGDSIESSQADSWIKALWVGFIPADDLKRPQVRATYDVLEHLVSAGLAAKHRFPRGYRYHLTLAGMPYYFDGNDFHNNPDHIPYLCYSKIVPEDVVWTQPARSERIADRTADVFRAAFRWHASESAAWANDAMLRSHSVVLAPVTAPAVATFARSGKAWSVESLSSAGSPMPRLADASVWPHGLP